MKKSKYIVILILAILLTFSITFVVTYKFIDNIKEIKNNILNNNSFMHKNSNLISKLNKLEDEEDAWYIKYHFISHSGGGINGKLFSNSLEAWNLSYENGNRVFDADLMFTSDNKLVARHDGQNYEQTSYAMKDSKYRLDGNGNFLQYYLDNIDVDNFTYDEFKNTKVYSKYTPIDCEMLIEYMNDHQDLYIATDMKDDIKESYTYLYNLAKEKNMLNVLDRIIVSVYDIDSYNTVKKIYNFKNFTMRQHMVDPQNYYDEVKFMVENNIHVLNVSQCYMTDEEIEEIEKLGIHVYVATVDYISDMNYYKSLGATGFISNWLYEDDYELE